MRPDINSMLEIYFGFISDISHDMSGFQSDLFKVACLHTMYVLHLA